jgi:hypothetical protein
MDLPEVLEAGACGRSQIGVAALSLAIVHQGDSRADGMNQLRRSGVGIAMARGVKDVEGPDQIVGADQLVLLVPGEIAEVEQPEAAVADEESDGFEILRRGVLLFACGIAAEWIGRAGSRRSDDGLGDEMAG